MTTIWSSAYPVSIDAFIPLIDHVDQVIANHPSELSNAIMALENKLGITNEPASGLGGLSFSPIGQALFPGVVGDPTIWIDNNFTPEHLIFTDSTGSDFDLILSGGSLDYAYDFGGAGVGRSITADAGSVQITVPNASLFSGLEIAQNNAGYFYPALLLNGASNLILATDRVDLQVSNYSTNSDLNLLSASFGGVDDSNASLIASVTLGGTGNSDVLVRSYTTDSGNATLAVTCSSGSGTSDILLESTDGTIRNISSGDTTFSANASADTYFNTLVDPILVGYTKTSLIGALNEVKTEVTSALLWSRAVTTLSPLTANDKVSVTSADASGVSVIAGIASGAGAYQNIGGDFSAAGSTGIGVKAVSSGATGYGVYGQTASNTGYSGYFTGGKFTATGYGDIALTSSNGNIGFNDQHLTAAINVSETGVAALVGYTATSLVGALNEVRLSSPSAALLLNQSSPQTVTAGRATFAEGFNLGLTPTPGIHSDGKVYWDATWKTMSIELEDSVILQVGQESQIYCYNGTGAPITQGSVVYIAGVNLGVPSIALAKADAIATSYVLGVVTSTSIADTTYGYVTSFGQVNNLDTSAFVVNDVLYLSPTTAGLLTNVQPGSGFYDVKVARVMTVDPATGRVFVNVRQETRLVDLSDVTVTTPAVDEVLRFNGVEWVNGAPATSSASSGIEFFPDSTAIVASSVENSFPIETLNKYPVTTTPQVVDAISCTAAGPVIGESYLYDTALGRTTIDSGNWGFDFYLSVSSIGGGRISYVTKNLYKVSPYSPTTVTITGGPGTTRTCTASGGTPFAVANVVADATVPSKTASFVQTPKGNYQITAITSDTVVTIAVPAAYVNETTVAFSVWKLLFGADSPTITNLTTSYGLYTTNTAQPAFSVAVTDKLGMIVFGTSNNTTTVNYVYNGSVNYSHFSSPLITLHNNLAGLQGGTSLEFYHLTSAAYTTLGGLTTIAQGDIAYGSAANTWSLLNKSAGTNYYLKNSGAGNNPAWAAITTSDVTTALTGFLYGNGTGITTAAIPVPTTITVANESTDTTCFPLFVTSSTPGDLGPKTVSSLTFNSNTGALASTLFSANTITANTAFVPDSNNDAALGTTSLGFSALHMGTGSAINWANGDVTLTHGSNLLTLAGGELALGTNNFTLTGSIASTGARVTKGWFADLESTAGIVLGLDAAALTPNTAGYIKMFSAGDNAFYTTFTAGTQTANATYTLPTAPPTVDGQALTSTITGVMSWGTIIGGDSEDGMAVYKNIYNDFTAVYKDADEIELVGLPFNITAVQIKKITRKPTGTAVSVVKNRGVDLVCIWTADGSIAGKGSITTTSLGTLASTDEYIVEVEGEPKGYMASTDSNKSYVVNDIMAINDGLIAAVTSDDVTITKSLMVDGFNAISLNVTIGGDGDFVKVLGTNDPAGVSGYYDITSLACGVPLIVTSGAYQTSGVIMFPYIQIVVDGNATSASAYLTRFLKK